MIVACRGYVIGFLMGGVGDSSNLRFHPKDSHLKESWEGVL